jgi:enoyl-CoA hydratase
MSDGDTFVRVEFEDRIAVIVIDRPAALNALNEAVLEGLEGALMEVVQQGSEVLILTGAGDRAFVAGADIKEMMELGASAATDFALMGQSLLEAIASFPGLTVAAVDGFALGGGMELAMACDLILAGPKAKFGQPEVKLGVIPGFGGTQRLVRRVGAQRAKELVFTGRTVSAEEAVSMGLALRVVDDPAQAARALAEEVLANGPLAVQAAKDCIDRAADLALADGLAYEAQSFGLLFATADQHEGMSAFVEKRSPAFLGE